MSFTPSSFRLPGRALNSRNHVVEGGVKGEPRHTGARRENNETTDSVILVNCDGQIPLVPERGGISVKKQNKKKLLNASVWNTSNSVVLMEKNSFMSQ